LPDQIEWSGTGSNCRPSAFQKVCRSRCHRVSIDQSAQLERIHPGSWADTTILTAVPRCAGECRFVRVTGVLDASWTRTCVALVLAAAAPVSRRLHPRTRPCRTGTRARPRLSTPTIFTRCRQPQDRLPAGLPAISLPPARPGMTHRDGQSMCRRIKSIHSDASIFVKAFFGRDFGGFAGCFRGRTRQGWAAPGEGRLLSGHTKFSSFGKGPGRSADRSKASTSAAAD
jgi:hypothetical protein